MGIWKYSGQMIKTESIRKLSNFNCQWAKTLCQIISIILHSVLPFSRAINVISYMNHYKDISYGGPRKQTSFKSFKFHKMKCYARRFYLCFLNSCEIWNLFSQAQMSILLLSHETPPMAFIPGLNMWCIYLLHGLFNELNLY